METFFLVLVHIVAVTALFISAYRTGFAVCEINARRQAEACAAPLTEMLEQLNLDVEKILEEPDIAAKGFRCEDTPRDFGPEGRSTDSGRNHTKG